MATCPFCAEDLAPGTPKCPHCGEDQGPRPAVPVGWGSPGKPAVVAVAGALSLLYGAVSFCGQAAGVGTLVALSGTGLTTQPFGPPGSGQRAFMLVALVLGALASVGHVAAGVGLLRLRPWGRRLALGLVVYGIGMSVVSLPFTLPAQVEQAGPGLESVIVATSIGGALFWLACLAAVGVVLTRSNVRAAFEPGGPA